ncbi:MAG: sigma 54-interacting transcriptional regulator [Isosphaeraceae bacterium]|nr:sigma 54-interacting transcriptional regulator [Isosphaeraceae bacterium]
MSSARDPGLRRLNALWKRASEPVFVLDAQRRLVYVNQAWEELTGYAADAVMGLECRPYGPTCGADREGLAASFCPPPEALAGQPAGGATLIVHTGGERRWRRIEFWPFHDERGHLLGLFGLVRPPDAPPHTPDSDAQHLRAELLELRQRLQERYGSDALIGRGPVHRRLLDQVATAAATSAPVLIIGEPGTGKRAVARQIHAQGPRRQAPLIPFDCAALTPEILQRELFGEGRLIPRLALPEGATLLLTDALELPRDLQARLAAALGPSAPVRLLATTTLDPEQARRDDRLERDLYYALTTLILRLPPLRERLEELPLLAQHFLERANLRHERRRLGFTSAALETLATYDWPGNLRELARVIEAAHQQATGDLIDAADLPASIRGHLGAAYNPPPMPPPVTPLDELLTRLERRLIEQALQRARQNKSRAAELLRISRPRLYRRIEELKIPVEPEPEDEVPMGNDSS